MPDTEPTPTKFTNLDATTTWCRTCDFAVSMPHEHAVTPTPPTVIDSDREIAARWFRSSPGDISAASALEAKMAAEIAAAREAWGVPREAVAVLVEAVEDVLKWADEVTRADVVRAALERVRKDLE